MLRHCFRLLSASGFLALVVAGWAAPHKVRVSDPGIASALIAGGGRLVADYGSFHLIETDAPLPTGVNADAVQVEDDSDFIELHARRLNTRAAEVRALRRGVGAFNGRRLHLVQFAGPPLPEWRERLEREGAQIVSYIPQNTYLIYGDAAVLARVQTWATTNSLVQWDGDYADDYKVHPRARLTDTQGRPQTPVTDQFAVQLQDDADANAATLAVIDRLKLAPIRNQFRTLNYLNVIVRLPPARLAELAAHPEVISIQPYPEPTRNDERQNQILAGNLSGTGPSGPGYLAWLASKGFTQEQFTASGFAVDVSDSGIDNASTTPNHFGLFQFGDLTKPSRVAYNRLVGTAHSGSTLQGCDGHGTINAHIIAGYNNQLVGFPHTDAAGYHYGLGVCPFVRVGSSVIFDPNTFTSPSYPNLQSSAYNSGARVSNNSWSANVSGAYGVDSQAYDALVRDAQPIGSSFPAAGNQGMVIVFAAGNQGSGSQTVGSPGTAKNVITVGATENVHSHSTANGGNSSSGNDGCATPDSQANSADDIATFSGRGPCSDGRAKPDLVAPGTHITGGVAQDSPAPSPLTTGNDLACFNGTGVCALPGGGSVGSPNNFFPLGQQFYTTSSGTSHSAPAVAGGCALLRQYFINQALPAPSPAMTKAYLINSARYLTGVSASDNLWSQHQGMGGMNLGMAFDGATRFLRDQLTQDKFTATGQQRTFTGRVSDSTKPLRITLAWTDAPGSTAGNAYNNNLDLTVTVGGNTYRGNVFSGALSAAGGSADARNNVESVFLPAGLTGTVVITVTAANINSDGVPNESPSVDQDFALVAYNASVPLVSLNSATLVAESCGNGNGAIDPQETVTLNVAFANIGQSPVTNLVVSLLPVNGVTAPGGAQTYGALLPGGAPKTNAFTFTANGSCGGALAAVFELVDGPHNLGSVTQSFSLGALTSQTSSWTNSTQINIPATGTRGIASPYPSTISVSGLTGTVGKVTVTLRGFAHTFPDDVDVLLVGPTGEKVLLMSDCGGNPNVTDLTLTLDDDALGALPDSSQIVSGTYKPTNYDTTSDAFNSPAPGGPYSTALSLFNGLEPNGTWSLFVQDDSNTDTGRFAQGWALNIVTYTANCCNAVPPGADLVLDVSTSTNQINLGDPIVFTLSITNLGPNSATGVTVLDWLPEGAEFQSASTTSGNCTNLGGLVLCELDTLTSNQTAVITVGVLATNAQMLTNTAVIASATPDPNATNNTATAVLWVNAAPTVSLITNQIGAEDTLLGPIEFVIGDTESPAGLLSLSGSSADTNLIPNENIVFGGSDENRTVTILPATNQSGIATITLTVGDGLATAGVSFEVTVLAVNDPPALSPIGDLEGNEGELISFTNAAADVDSPLAALVFSLGTNAPSGATLNPTNGVFTWTPEESQGPGTYPITVRVDDDGVPPLSDERTFTVVVHEVNSPPVLTVPPDQTVYEGQLLTLTNLATDPDLPANTLTFEMDTIAAPVGAAVDSVNGRFTWIPDAVHLGTNVITIIVTDNGSPVLSDSKSFTVIVVGRPVIESVVFDGGNVMLTWSAIPGRTYRAQFKESLDDPDWQDVLPDVTAVGPTASASHPVGNAVRRFYRVQLAD